MQNLTTIMSQIDPQCYRPHEARFVADPNKVLNRSGAPMKIEFGGLKHQQVELAHHIGIKVRRDVTQGQ